MRSQCFRNYMTAIMRRLMHILYCQCRRQVSNMILLSLFPLLVLGRVPIIRKEINVSPVGATGVVPRFCWSSCCSRYCLYACIVVVSLLSLYSNGTSDLCTVCPSYKTLTVKPVLRGHHWGKEKVIF